MSTSREGYSGSMATLDDETAKEIAAFRAGLAKRHGMDGESADAAPSTKRYNKDALVAKLQDIKCSWPWFERLDVTTTAVVEDSVPQVDDDLNRELQFFQSAVKAVAGAHAKLEKEGIPHMRPHDYYAEMIKTDEHIPNQT